MLEKPVAGFRPLIWGAVKSRWKAVGKIRFAPLEASQSNGKKHNYAYFKKKLVLKQLGHTYLITTSKYHSANHKSEKYAFGFEIILDHLQAI